MPFYSPLRYPGGKRRLAGFVKRLLQANDLHHIDYAEPYAGGASLALELLFEGHASRVHLNDLSRPVYAFWYSVLNEEDALCERIDRIPVTIEEWHRQREVLGRRETAELLDLGFATFFLNRTNRSGIIDGGVIGGQEQTGAWGIDARFTKAALIQRIRCVARHREQIHLYHQDALDFVGNVVARLPSASLTFFDPPYIAKGASLYLNNYSVQDHIAMAEHVMALRQPWVVTYDYAPAVAHNLYSGRTRLAFQLSYSAQERRGGMEAMFLADSLALPSSTEHGILMTTEGSRYPLHATIEATAVPAEPLARRISRARLKR